MWCPSFSSNNIYVFFCVQHFYHVLMCLRKPQGKGLELAKKHIMSCLSELDSMLKTEEFLRHNSACGTIENEDDITTASGCQPVGFDPTLNSRSAAPTPPRAIKLLSWRKVRFSLLLVGLLIIHSWPGCKLLFCSASVRQLITSRSFFMILMLYVPTLWILFLKPPCALWLIFRSFSQIWLLELISRFESDTSLVWFYIYLIWFF